MLHSLAVVFVVPFCSLNDLIQALNPKCIFWNFATDLQKKNKKKLFVVHSGGCGRCKSCEGSGNTSLLLQCVNSRLNILAAIVQCGFTAANHGDAAEVNKRTMWQTTTPPASSARDRPSSSSSGSGVDVRDLPEVVWLSPMSTVDELGPQAQPLQGLVTQHYQ